jgi:hypothetical protein
LDDFIENLKLSYITLKRNNLRIFGISKSKTLSEFVTTEQDVKKGNNRLPLNLARLYEEDLMTDEDVEKAMVEMKMQGMKIVSLADSQGENLFVQEDLMKVAETRNHAMRRQSEVQKKPAAKPSPKDTSMTLYTKDSCEE